MNKAKNEVKELLTKFDRLKLDHKKELNDLESSMKKQQQVDPQQADNNQQEMYEQWIINFEEHIESMREKYEQDT